MEVQFPKPGTYIAAVSGGVDSVVLLDLLSKQPGLWLVVAHFDHGIRISSAQDRLFVEQLAQHYKLPFEYAEGKLGEKASEATARRVRYDFLSKMLIKYEAQAIMTAHHQDDLLETAILNMLRGTGRKGLTALKSRSGDKQRPLLKVSKQQILDYAKAHHLKWREDISNRDTNYLRNYIRHNILPRLGTAQRAKLLRLLANLSLTNQELDDLLAGIVKTQNQLNRVWFNKLPHQVAKEVMATWLRQHELRDFDRQTLERLTVAAKTAQPGSQVDVIKGASIKINRDNLALVLPER